MPKQMYIILEGAFYVVFLLVSGDSWFCHGNTINLVRLCLLAKDFGAHMISNSLSTVDDEIP